MVTTRSLYDHVFLRPGLMPSPNTHWGIAADWLNASRGTDSHNRVVKIIDELRQIAIGMDRGLEGGKIVIHHRTKADQEALDDLERRHSALNESLTRYSFTPAITRVWLGKRWLLSTYSSPDEGQFIFERHVAEKSQTSELSLQHTVSEAVAVLHILLLASDDALDRLKQCDLCRQWFYAERRHQEFCSGDCRKKKYSASPRFKEYRKQYMRKHRDSERSRLQRTNGRRSSRARRPR
jgi:hypothetical protein